MADETPTTDPVSTPANMPQPDQIPGLVQAGAITPEQADRFYTAYGMSAPGSVGQDIAPAAPAPPPQAPIGPPPPVTGVIGAQDPSTINIIPKEFGEPKPALAADMKAPESGAPQGTLASDKVPEGQAPVHTIPETTIVGHPTPATPGATSPSGTPAQAPKEKPLSPAEQSYQDYLKTLSDQRQAAIDLGQKQQSALQTQADAQKALNTAVAADKVAAYNQSQIDLANQRFRMQDAVNAANHADEEAAARARELANRKIDTGRAFDAGPFGRTGNKIAAVIGMSLGAMGSALAKTPNFAMQIVNDAINRDIQAQREEIQNAKDSNQMLMQIAHQKYGRAMDQNQLDNQTRLEGLNYALAQVDLKAAGMQGAVDQAKTDAMKLQIQAEIDKTKGTIAAEAFKASQEREHQRMEQQKINIMAAKAAGAGAGKAGMTAKELQEKVVAERQKLMDNPQFAMGEPENVRWEKASARAVAMMGYGLPGAEHTSAEIGNVSPKTHDEQKAEKEKLQQYDIALDNLYKIRKMIESGGELNRSRTAEGESLVSGAYNALARAETGGKRAPSEAEIELLKKQIPSDPNAYQFSGHDLSKINATIQQVEYARGLVGGSVPREDKEKALGIKKGQ